jgi:hypothetical protein
MFIPFVALTQTHIHICTIEDVTYEPEPTNINIYQYQQQPLSHVWLSLHSMLWWIGRTESPAGQRRCWLQSGMVPIAYPCKAKNGNGWTLQQDRKRKGNGKLQLRWGDHCRPLETQNLFISPQSVDTQDMRSWSKERTTDRYTWDTGHALIITSSAILTKNVHFWWSSVRPATSPLNFRQTQYIVHQATCVRV